MTAISSDISTLRGSEYSRLGESGHVYLDYTGAGLYPDSVVRQHTSLLTKGIFGNPHSANPSSLAATGLIEETRKAILKFFNAPEGEYDVVFTLNASGALKLVGEAYPFGPTSGFVLTYDNHNSVNGIREFARARGAQFFYAPITDPDLRIDEPALAALLDAGEGSSKGLFAFPAQSNFSGVLHDLSWIEYAHARGWHVLLDAAAFVPTNRLDLATVKPDFVPISFYKIVGYPTGVGCLLVRKQVEQQLVRPWFAGGTVVLASADMTPCESSLGFSREVGAAAFEDGTLSFLSIPAVKLGLEYISSVSVDRIHDHVLSLTSELLEQLVSLRHSNGQRLVHIYGPETADARGGTLAMNLFDPDDRLVHARTVEAAASDRNISLRTGCHCNPGAGQTALHIPGEEFESVFRAREKMSLKRFRLVASAVREGAVRVSLGIASDRGDIDAFVNMLRQFLDQPAQ